MSAIQVDTTRLPLLLHDLRLPAIARLWPEFAERADKEGWPAARFLAALAELEIAERGRRRTERNLAEARLLPSKTLDNFDFSVVPMLSKARVMALAAGDTWLDKATNLLLFGPPGTGKSHCASALGRALVENGFRVLFTRTTDIVQKLQAARQALQLEAAISKLDKYHLLILDLCAARSDVELEIRNAAMMRICWPPAPHNLSEVHSIQWGAQSRFSQSTMLTAAEVTWPARGGASISGNTCISAWRLRSRSALA